MTSSDMSIPRCSSCDKNAVTFIRYSGRHLCYKHLSDFVLRRARKAFREQYKVPQGGNIAVAVSGGKDSIAALHITWEIFGEHKDKNIFVVTVDEGIAGYRPESINVASRCSESLGLEHVVISFKDMYGGSLDELLKNKRTLGACSYCGVLRRKAMNIAARRGGASALVTGLNLDDVCQGILMNFTRGDVERLARMGPHNSIQPGLVPRLLPLRSVPEKESYLYCLANKLEFYEGECPYASEAQRGLYRDILNRMEDATPGARHSILRSQDELLPLIFQAYPSANLSPCMKCGEPTIKDACRACLFLNELEKA